MAENDSTLPPALRNPPCGRYEVEDAIRVWMCAYYGVRADADPKAHERVYRKARADLRHLIRSEVVRPANPVLAALGRKWQGRGSPAPRIGEAEHAHWIEKDDLERLASERGFHLFGAAQRAPSARPPGPKHKLSKNDEATEYAEKLIADGMQMTRAAQEAAEKFGCNPGTIDRKRREREREKES